MKKKAQRRRLSFRKDKSQDGLKVEKEGFEREGDCKAFSRRNIERLDSPQLRSTELNQRRVPGDALIVIIPVHRVSSVNTYYFGNKSTYSTVV